MKEGLLAACGRSSWKSSNFKHSAANALGLVARLINPEANVHWESFHRILHACDQVQARNLMKLMDHSSEKRGNPQAAVYVRDFFAGKIKARCIFGFASVLL